MPINSQPVPLFVFDSSKQQVITEELNPSVESPTEQDNTPTNTNTHNKRRNISAIATQLQQLQSRNHSQSSEIAHLKRQIKILSEFKGYDDGSGCGRGIVGPRRELWKAKERRAAAHDEGIMDHANSMSSPNNKVSSSSTIIAQADDNDNGSSSNTTPDHSNKHPSFIASVNSTDSINPLFSSTGSLPLFQQTENKYDDYDDAQLEEFARIASPKVSELLNEQAMALDDLLDTPGWSSSSSDGDGDSDDYSDRKQWRMRRRRKKRQHKSGNRPSGGDAGYEDEDSMNEEWNQLEAAQLNLQDELEAATNGFDQLFGEDENGDYDFVDHQNEIGSQNNDKMEGKDGAESKNDSAYSEEWRDSIHQYYADNKQSTGRANKTSPSTMPSPAFLSKPNHSYSLADHALTLDVSRPASDRGLYTKPLLSRNELETLGIVTMPSSIARPSGEVSSRGREKYMKRILDCTVEYIEPPKSKILRRLFSGWNPGPGERKPDDDGGERVVNRGGGGGGGDASQRVMAYSPTHNSNEDADSSVEGEDNHGGGFEDIDGTAYASPTSHRVMEPLPVRTVTIRIRCDVMCGAVMDALTTSVERVGGEMTKRQGGHLRAVLPGRKMRAWMPGERERENRERNSFDIGGQSTPQRGESKDNGEAAHHQENDVNRHDNNDDASSIASGFSTILSPILGTSHSKRKGPTYAVIPPYIVDAQLVTKKVGKECQRLVLIRIYRMQDVARVRSYMGDENNEEAFDVIAPLDSTGDGGIGRSTLYDQQNDGEFNNSADSNGVGGKTKVVDPLLESKRSLKSLQEAAALVQRIKAVGGLGFAIDPPLPSEGDAATVSSHTSTKSYLKSLISPIRYFGGNSAVSPMETSSSSPYPTVMELMSTELLRKHRSSPSVGTNSKSGLAAAKQRSHGIFPALAKEDEPYVKSSWTFLRDCIEELDRSRLAYSTLGMYPIFRLPALPTPDVHFIAQIKGFCRESMIVSLVKTASELEVYAREFEVSCGNVDSLLRPTFGLYKLAPPQLPMPVPLTAYPLDFRAPEEISPPWGPEVMTTLEKISNDIVINSTESDQALKKKNDQTQNHLSSFERSEKAVSIIVAAFQRQNDVEQGARLGRKNMQVMDRLAKMQAHKRNSIAKIRDSYGSNLLATKAADEFHSLRQKSSNIGSLTDVINAVPDEVPLLICNVLVGNAAGTCYVTHSHILFITQLVPILGGSKIHLFSIMDVDVTINAPSKSMLSPLPASISFTTEIFGSGRSTREEVYNFIPSIGARRFAKFLETLRDFMLEDPDSLKFSEKGGLIYLAD